jgi:hypothetical protein
MTEQARWRARFRDPTEVKPCVAASCPAPIERPGNLVGVTPKCVPPVRQHRIAAPDSPGCRLTPINLVD